MNIIATDSALGAATDSALGARAGPAFATISDKSPASVSFPPAVAAID